MEAVHVHRAGHLGVAERHDSCGIGWRAHASLLLFLRMPLAWLGLAVIGRQRWGWGWGWGSFAFGLFLPWINELYVRCFLNLRHRSALGKQMPVKQLQDGSVVATS